MIQQEVILAGFGGQGVLMAGQLLAYAGLLEGKQVVWVPSYGPEMRGGTAHCSVIISDKTIGSPVVEKPGAALIFNQPSLDKFAGRVRPGGILLVNSSMASVVVGHNDLKVHLVPVNEISQNIGHSKGANMVMLGAYLELTGVVSVVSVMNALSKMLPAHKQNLLKINRKAIELGAEIVYQSKGC